MTDIQKVIESVPVPGSYPLPMIPFPSLDKIDIRPHRGAKIRYTEWVFTYSDGTVHTTRDGSEAEMLSRQFFPSLYKKNVE